MRREHNHITDQHGCYYLTFNTVDWVDLFIRPVYKKIITDTLNLFVAANVLEIYAWCLMTNHIHLVCRSLRDYGISNIERDFKKETTKKVFAEIDIEPEVRRQWMMKLFENFSQSLRRIEKFNLWQTCSHPVHINTEQGGELHRYMQHVHDNPLRDGVVNKAEDYLYSSARDYQGMKGLVKLTMVQNFSHPFYHKMLTRENGN